MHKIVLGKEIDILPGYPFNSKLFSEETGIPLIRIRDLSTHISNTYFIGAFSTAYLIQKGDILIGMDGDFNIVKWKGIPGLLNQRILKIYRKQKSGVDINYIFYRLQRLLLVINSRTAATTVKHLSTYDISDLELKVPSLPHQRKIAAILSTVDAQIEKTEAIIAKYQSIKQGMLHDLFTRGIDVKTGTLRPTYKEAPELYKDSPLGIIPKEWKTEKLSEITLQIIDGTHFTPIYTETGIPFLRVTDIQNEKIDTKQTKYISKAEHDFLIRRCKPSKGDILISKNGTIGITKVIDWDWEFSIFVSLCLIRLKGGIVSTQLLNSQLNSFILHDQIRKRSKQGTVTNLHLEEIRELDIFIPIQNKEQDEIVTRINSINRLISIEQRGLEKNKLLKQGLMSDLLSGKVQVTIIETATT